MRKTEQDLFTKELQYAHLNLDISKIDFKSLKNPLNSYRSLEQYIEMLKIIRNPDNFYFTLKYIFNIEPTVFQLVWLQMMWKYPFPMVIATRGGSKSFLYGLMCLLRALITQGSKVVIVSASFRQAKNVFEYAETILNNAPILKDLIGGNLRILHGNDMWTMYIGDSTIRAVPLGNSGQKIRGLRATHIILDEFSAIAEEIYEVVIRGFGSVSSSPSENVIKMAKINLLKEKGLWTKENEKAFQSSERPNQIILAGTADWGFRHFAKYWRRYKTIINSKGDKRILEDAGIITDEAFDYKDYCIIRMPIELMPDGFMDNKSIAQAKASMNISRYQCELGSCFVDDSNGFFKRTLIESCVTKEPIYLPSGPAQFRARLMGDPRGKYIYGIDPASETDNFAVVILEQHIDHNRVVYCWTTTRERMRKNRIAGMIAKEDNDFYQYIAKKIRSLMKVFPTNLIALDSQGGGYGVMEALHNLKALEPGELPIWPINEDHPIFWKGGKNYGYDDEVGLHIIEMVEFVRTEYRIESNHTLKREMENKTLLFPIFDPIEFSIAADEDERADRNFDTLENVIAEIEELKEELSTIQHTTTQTGKDRWDTPEIILPGQRKGRLRKDRYSALLMAAYASFRCNKPTTIGERQFAGGIAQTVDVRKQISGPLYNGPNWVTDAIKESRYFSPNQHYSPSKLEYNARGVS